MNDPRVTDVITLIRRLERRVALIEGLEGVAQYIHSQLSPSATWTINHNLGRRPTIIAVDGSGGVFGGDTSYPSANTAVLTFNAAIAGTAYCD